MNTAWQKTKAWTRFVLMVILVAYLVAFVLLNSGQSVSLWLFVGVRPQVSLLLLIFLTLVAGALVVVAWRAIAESIYQLKQFFAPRAGAAEKDGGGKENG